MIVDGNEKAQQRAELMNLLGQLQLEKFDCVIQSQIIKALDELWEKYAKEHKNELKRLERLAQQKRES